MNGRPDAGGVEMETVGAKQTEKPVSNGPISDRPDPHQEASLHEHLLAGVSRTFAFTIPQLPDGLREAVTNAYLLCRIADTIEDDPILDTEIKDSFHTAFLESAESGRGAEDFAQTVWPRLAPGTLEAEIELMRESPRVLRMTHQLLPRQRSAILRCLTTMSGGMGQFERSRSRGGLSDVAELERYCYFVAGVVGEISFGLGLQMTNILKDVWDDYENGVCWFPRDVFERYGYDLSELQPHHNGNGPAFAASIQHMVGIAHAHLREALEYTLTIPSTEAGIRRFLIWAALLAASTLRNISVQPLFTAASEVKVSRRKVAGIVALSNAVIRSNFGLSALFNAAARGLPLESGNGSSTTTGKESKTP